MKIKQSYYINKISVLSDGGDIIIDLFIPEKAIGWLYFTINKNSFYVSYLSDFINDMNTLLNFDNNDYDMKVNRIYLDGEGEDLYLTAWKNGETLFLVWEHETNTIKTELMTFDYDEFVIEFHNNFESIRDDYYTKFDLDSMYED